MRDFDSEGAETFPGDTLYERLGGDEQMKFIISNFYDEIEEDMRLRPLFRNVPISALIMHQQTIFRRLFGPEEERPSIEDLQTSLLLAHNRLFREEGLTGEHFDIVAQCLINGLQTLQIEQVLINEVLALLSPLRKVFEYGAQVVAKEKQLTENERRLLPDVSSLAIGIDETMTLPSVPVEIPQWLSETLGRYSPVSDVRAWTCELTTQFMVDDRIVETFKDLAPSDLHAYLVLFLQLAFLPKGLLDSLKLLQDVRFPRAFGRDDGPSLSLALWNRMVIRFARAANNMSMETFNIAKAVGTLQSYDEDFAWATTEKTSQRRQQGHDVCAGDYSENSITSVGSLASVTMPYMPPKERNSKKRRAGLNWRFWGRRLPAGKATTAGPTKIVR